MSTTPRTTDYTNAAQQRLMDVVMALFGDVLLGVTPTALAKTVGCSQSVITRDLDNLRTKGWAERDEKTGFWRLTPRLPQQNFKVLAMWDRTQKQLDESRQRFTRTPD